MSYPHLLRPFKLKDLTIPNRILMAATSNNLSGVQGIVASLAVAYCPARARGVVGMGITGATAVSSHRSILLMLEKKGEHFMRFGNV
jgi:2,4-dienoyl-CoA reductase-like NADH-dependent reductase (Old Yellow Enzyme family)